MHIYKNTFFSFFNKHFWSVDSKSAIHFFRRALENPDNPEKSQKTNFSGLSRFSSIGQFGLKKWTSAFVSAGQEKPY